jgi:hypothetical protein
MNPKLLGYVAKARGAGRSDGEIASKLAAAGIPQDEVKAALEAASSPRAAPASGEGVPAVGPSGDVPPLDEMLGPAPAALPEGRARVVFAVLLLLGAGAVLFGFGIYSSGAASAGWPTASGVVEASRVTSSRDSDGGTTYGASVEYGYTVRGRGYRSRKVTAGDYSSSDRSRAEGIVSKYPAGRQVAVRYDPANPSEAVLEPGVPWMSFLMVILLGVLFAVVGLAGLLGRIKPALSGPARQPPGHGGFRWGVRVK